ncbi:hypothetical protein LPJ66_011772, partial [Kickxella alabastrina]
MDDDDINGDDPSMYRITFTPNHRNKDGSGDKEDTEDQVMDDVAERRESTPAGSVSQATGLNAATDGEADSVDSVESVDSVDVKRLKLSVSA